MSNIHSPQSWKKSNLKRKQSALKGYRPIIEKAKKFKSKKIGKTNLSLSQRFFRNIIKLAVFLFIFGCVFWNL